jgi:hypothetical protein
MGDQAILLVSWAGTIHLAKEQLEGPLKNYGRDIVVVINEIEAVKDHDTLAWLMANHKVIPIDGNRWELGALEAILVFTDYQEWILIQDTLEILDTSIFDRMFDEFPYRSVAFGPGWMCYLGKYRRAILLQFPIPTALNKMDAFYYEHVLPTMYDFMARQIEGQESHVMFPEWLNTNPDNYYEEKFGRKNLVLANPYLLKRKSTEWKGPFGLRAAVYHGDKDE